MNTIGVFNEAERAWPIPHAQLKPDWTVYIFIVGYGNRLA